MEMDNHCLLYWLCDCGPLGNVCCVGHITALDGGNFASAFVSAAASSGIGSYARGVYMNSNIL